VIRSSDGLDERQAGVGGGGVEIDDDHAEDLGRDELQGLLGRGRARHRQATGPEDLLQTALHGRVAVDDEDLGAGELALLRHDAAFVSHLPGPRPRSGREGNGQTNSMASVPGAG